MRLHTSLFCAVLIGALATAAGEPKQKEIDEAVRKLGSDDFDVRQSAFTFLWKAGKHSVRALQAAQNSTDLECAGQAKRILKNIEFGITPEMSAEQANKARKYFASNYLVREGMLGDLAETNDAGDKELLAALYRREPDPSVRRTWTFSRPDSQFQLEWSPEDSRLDYFNSDAHRRSDILKRLACSGYPDDVEFFAVLYFAEKDAAVRAFAIDKTSSRHNNQLEKNDLDGAERILSALASTGIKESIWAWTDFLLTRQMLGKGILKAQQFPEGVGKQRALAFLHRANGETEKSTAAAEKTNDRDFYRSLLLESRDWRKICELLTDAPATISAETRAYELALLAYSLLRLEKTNECRGVLQRLETLAAENKTLQKTFAVAHLICDQPEKGISELLRGGFYSEAAEMRFSQRRLDDALAIQRDSPAVGEQLAALLLNSAEVMKWACDFESERELRNRELPMGFSKLEKRMAEHCIALRNAGKQAQSREKAVEYLNRLEKDRKRFLQEYASRRTDYWTTAFWWSYFSCVSPNSTDSQRFEELDRILNGKLSSSELESIFERAVSLTDEKKIDEKVAFALCVAISDAAQLAMNRDLEEKWLKKTAKWSLPPTVNRQAEIALSRGENSEVLGLRWQSVLDSRKHYYTGLAQRRLGNEIESRKHMEMSRLLSTANIYDRFYMAKMMLRLEEDQDAINLLNGMKLTTPPHYSGKEQAPHDSLAEEADRIGDLARALALRESRLLCGLGESDFFKHMMRECAQIHSLRGRIALQAGDTRAALSEMKLALDYDPCHVEGVLGEIVNALDKQELRKEADAFFERALDIHRQALVRWPDSRWIHNSFAWVCARCNRRLDEALEHAQKAMKCDEECVTFWDTLATVHFARGEKEQAIELQRKCVARNPSRASYKKRLKAMENAMMN